MSRLLELTTDGGFRKKVEGLLADLDARGEPSRVAEALRTEAQQREMVRRKVSKTMNSYHRAGRDGKARAADVVHVKLGWEASERYWLILGAYALRTGLGWGGLFGFSAAQKKAVLAKIEECVALDWPPSSHRVYRPVVRSWDPAHVEVPNNWPDSAILRGETGLRLEAGVSGQIGGGARGAAGHVEAARGAAGRVPR